METLQCVINVCRIQPDIRLIVYFCLFDSQMFLLNKKNKLNFLKTNAASFYFGPILAHIVSLFFSPSSFFHLPHSSCPLVSNVFPNVNNLYTLVTIVTPAHTHLLPSQGIKTVNYWLIIPSSLSTLKVLTSWIVQNYFLHHPWIHRCTPCYSSFRL